jgi:alpha-glucosidase
VERWCAQAVVYQIYPRSFQDSNGDGVGDLAGVRQRLGHLVELGVDALWLSPVYPSPNADWGYDVTDHTGVHPDFGTLSDARELIADAHARGLRVLFDLIPNHTSIEHPWFREHPDWYVWADERPNNWLSAFGGSAWNRDEQTGRYYLHSFYPEQPDLDWRHPGVREAVGDVVRFWLDAGVDGFRVDAVDRLSKDPQLRDDPAATEPWLLPLPEDYGALRHAHSRNAPGIEDILDSLRASAGGATLVGEVYRPTAELLPYVGAFDLVFAFELMFAAWNAERVGTLLEPAHALRRIAWVLANHDFTRLATRVGPENARLAALLQLTLPGAAFVYQGDEIGLEDGQGADPPLDRAGRDRARHPMQWTAEPLGGFTEGAPWLPLVDPERRNVEAQRGDPGSLLELYRRLIELRRELGSGFELLRTHDGVLAYRRGPFEVHLNFTAEPRRLSRTLDVAVATEPAPPGVLPARAGVIGLA